MKRAILVGLCTFAMILGITTVGKAAVPGQINHQGYLTDDTGAPINGDVELYFTLYDGELGGTAVWSEGPMTVTVSNGIFQVVLGETTPLTPDHFSGLRWLAVTVNGEPLEPREPVVSAPFAIESQNADTVDGVDAATLEESQELITTIDFHSTNPSAHHARYTDSAAVAACDAAGMEESAEIDSDISAHASDMSAHHTKTTSFAELTDTATDAQIPDGITIEYATSAGDADTVDGEHAFSFVQPDELWAAIDLHGVSPNHDESYVNRDGDDMSGDLRIGEEYPEMAPILGTDHKLQVVTHSNCAYGKCTAIHAANGDEHTPGGVAIRADSHANDTAVVLLNQFGEGDLIRGDSYVGGWQRVFKVEYNGATTCSVLNITGGSDIAEPFDIEGDRNIRAGSVLIIDPEIPGRLRVSEKAYDRRVAGIVSGAGGIDPGMMLGQRGTIADGEHPVTITGRACVWTDTSNGPVSPGDLLTTSDLPGYAMKVTDYDKALGAIIGKAMSSLDEGNGLVLALINLQ